MKEMFLQALLPISAYTDCTLPPKGEVLLTED